MKKFKRCLSVVLAVMLLLMAVPFTASAAHVYDIFSGVLHDDLGETMTFTPEESGYYCFYSVCEDDTYATLYDDSMVELSYSDDTEEGLDFYIKYYLFEGETYYLEFNAYNATEITPVRLEVYIEKAVYAVDATIIYEPEDKFVYEGAELETLNINDLFIEFELSDGTTEIWYGMDDNTIANEFVYRDFRTDENGEIYVDDGKVFLYISCDDAYVELEFELLDNPVESFEINSDIVLYEEYDGVMDEDTGVFEYWYQFDPEDTVTVYYKDGTSVTDKVMFFWDDYGCFVDTYDTQDKDPWAVGEDNFFYATYFGHEIKVPVEILPVPVKNVELTKLPDRTEYEGYYRPLWQGAEITLTLEDGTKVSETINEGDLVYNAYLDYFTVEVGGLDVLIYPWGDNYEIACFDVVYVVEEGFTYTEPKAIADRTVVKATETGLDTVIEVEYKDGTKETFSFDVMDFWEAMNMSFGLILTEHGYAEYSIEPVDDGEEIIGYDIWFLDDYVFAPLDKMIIDSDISITIGDADENGTVNIKDATIIQKHVADFVTLEGVGEAVADVDGNGDVNVKDATAIQKYVAGIETGYPIGDRVN